MDKVVFSTVQAECWMGGSDKIESLNSKISEFKIVSSTQENQI